MSGTLSAEQISGKVLDHLGLVAATMDKIGLIEKIDKLLPLSKEKGVKTTIGERVAAMILNGLGFIDDRLYMFPDFLRNKPVDRLLGEGLHAGDFNDDALGRGLDKIYAYGCTPLFSHLAFEIGMEQKLLGRSAHIDTSTLSLEGDYEEENDGETVMAVPRYGYSKDHRADLKQMVINLATTGAAGFPIWMESHSGNTSDKKILYECAKKMQAFCKHLKEAPSFLYVADSAMYESCLKEANELVWLSRVPGNHKVVKEMLRQEEESFCWSELEDNYKMCVVETKYRSVHQRWGLIYSKQAFDQEMATLNKRISREYEEIKKALWHLSHKSFGCAKDARKAAHELSKALTYHKVEFTVTEIAKHEGKGRPSKRAHPSLRGYQVTGEITQDEEKIGPLRNEKGRFILATNQLDRERLPDAALLSEYKDQLKTESGFRFLKDDTFEVSSVFLKKPERIAALMMVMTLCLMVYAFAQYEFRKALQAANDTIPNQLKKATDKSTMKWVYRLLHGVQVLTIQLERGVQEIVINLNEVTRKIIGYFGNKALQIYGLGPPSIAPRLS